MYKMCRAAQGDLAVSLICLYCTHTTSPIVLSPYLEHFKYNGQIGENILVTKD